MITPDVKPFFNEAQLELLKLFKEFKVGTNELTDIKKLLAGYFMNKARNSADEVWKEKGYDENTINKWLEKKP